MTPVQSAAIPQFLSNKDVVVEAVTGSGKTLAFVIPILEMLLKRQKSNHPLKKNQIGAIVIAPTRELASQIYEVTQNCLAILQNNDPTITKENDTLSSSLSIKPQENGEKTEVNLVSAQLFIGGNHVQEDIQCFQSKGGQIVIGTPGRLEDLIKRNQIFDTKELEVLVMDEADRLLAMGFANTLKAIISRIPKQRRTGLFSATMTDALSELVRAGLRNPVKIVVKVESITKGGEIKVPESLSIKYKIIQQQEKFPFLIQFLKQNLKNKFIIYLGTCACVDYLFKIIHDLKILPKFSLHSLHGKMDGKKRNLAFQKFSQAPFPAMLLCTDVAARGLDMPDIDWVIQVDPPQDPQSFNHRCGRTARMGREGNAMIMLTPEEETFIEFLNIRKVPLDEFNETVDGLEKLTPKMWLRQLRNLNAKDRDCYEKSIKAFVSWVRSYHEHEAKYIFQFKNVNLSQLAKSFGLLHLPKMPELKSMNQTQHQKHHAQLKNKTSTGEVTNNNSNNETNGDKDSDDDGFQPLFMDYSLIPFKDKQRERSRQKKLILVKQEEEQRKLELKLKKRKANESWSVQKEQKEKRSERKLKKLKKREAIMKKQTEEQINEKQKQQEESEEWLELQKEAREMKKNKKRQNDVSDSSDNNDDDQDFSDSD